MILKSQIDFNVKLTLGNCFFNVKIMLYLGK